MSMITTVSFQFVINLYIIGYINSNTTYMYAEVFSYFSVFLWTFCSYSMAQAPWSLHSCARADSRVCWHCAAAAGGKAGCARNTRGADFAQTNVSVIFERPFRQFRTAARAGAKMGHQFVAPLQNSMAWPFWWLGFVLQRKSLENFPSDTTR